jgi:hypothetical protein
MPQLPKTLQQLRSAATIAEKTISTDVGVEIPNSVAVVVFVTHIAFVDVAVVTNTVVVDAVG